MNAEMLLYVVVVDTYFEEACSFTGGSRVNSSCDTLYEHKSQHHSLPSTILMRIQ